MWIDTTNGDTAEAIKSYSLPLNVLRDDFHDGAPDIGGGSATPRDPGAVLHELAVAYQIDHGATYEHALAAVQADPRNATLTRAYAADFTPTAPRRRGEDVHHAICAYAERHGCDYTTAFDAVVYNRHASDVVRAYAAGGA